MTTLRLFDHGATFATRERAGVIADDLKRPPTAVDFEKVRAASPGFLDALFSRVGAGLPVKNVPEALVPLVQRVRARRLAGELLSAAQLLQVFESSESP